jgi:hypothetical protein
MAFNYGQEVIYKPQEIGSTEPAKCSIVSITPIETVEQSEAFGFPQGTIMYTIEFGDGTDKLVPQNELVAT